MKYACRLWLPGILLGTFLVASTAGAVGAQDKTAADGIPAVAASEPGGGSVGDRREEPEWLAKTQGGGQAAETVSHRRSAMRSIGSLLLMIGLMLGANYWLRRRMTVQRTAGGGQTLKVKARLRVGMRQEVVVVEWEGEEIVLGVGPTFIQPLHARKGNGSVAAAQAEEAVHAG